MISLPSKNWFVQIQGEKIIKNIYTGSTGTDPNRGCISRTSFNYKVYVEGETEDALSLVVECYFIKPWKEGSKKRQMRVFKEKMSQEGIDKTEKWLDEQSRNLTE